MRFGPRKPNFKTRFKARTAGKLKRQFKRTFIPGYGKKGVGLIKNPNKSLYNKVYNKTTFGIFDSKKYNKKTKSTSEHIINTKYTSNSFHTSNNPYIPKNSSTYTESSEIHNKQKSLRYVLIGTVAGYLLYGLIGSIIGSYIAFILLININKKQTTEYNELTDEFSINELNSVLDLLSDKQFSYYWYMAILDRTNNLKVFFEHLYSLESVINEIESLAKLYDVSKIISNIEEITTFSREKKYSLISSFIIRYHKREETSASKLKTEKGYLNRMVRKKDDLLFYKNELSNDNLKLIDDLWSSNNFNKNNSNN